MAFEDKTFDILMQEALDDAPAEIDTRQGSIFFDAVAGVILKIAKLYSDLDEIAEMIYIDSTTGEYLDRKAAEFSVVRLAATHSKYECSLEGTAPEVGERFYTNGIFFVLGKDDSDEYYLEAEEAGTEANAIYAGTSAIPVDTIPDLVSATFGVLIEAGADEESDDELRERLRSKIAGPAENGNIQHYRTWCEQIDGVGKAIIIPLWNGPNTVKGVIIGPDGRPATQSVINRVQEYIDPDQDEDGEGDGLGEGVANIGAHFTAVAPTVRTVNIVFNADITGDATVESVTADVTSAISEYLQELVMDRTEDSVTVKYNAIGTKIYGLSSVVDYSSLTINGSTVNIELAKTEVPVVGEVTVNVL